MHFERQNAFQNAQNSCFFQIFFFKKCVCLPYLKFSDPLSEKNLSLDLALGPNGLPSV